MTTVPEFVRTFQPPPVGFVSIDLDLYSSTREALQIFARSDMRMLRHVPLYVDDIDFFASHDHAGELLAISEFNESHRDVRIDRWRGVRNARPFPEAPYLGRLYVAHDLVAVSNVALERPAITLPLKM